MSEKDREIDWTAIADLASRVEAIFANEGKYLNEPVSLQNAFIAMQYIMLKQIKNDVKDSDFDGLSFFSEFKLGRSRFKVTTTAEKIKSPKKGKKYDA